MSVLLSYEFLSSIISLVSPERLSAVLLGEPCGSKTSHSLCKNVLSFLNSKRVFLSIIELLLNFFFD